MRKNSVFLLTILIFLFTSTAFCQESSSKLTFNIYGGYGLANWSGDNFTLLGGTHPDNTTAFAKTDYGLGSGFHTGIGAQWKLNSVLSIGVDADYFSGKKSGSQNLPEDTLSGNFTTSHSVISLIPNISFRLLSNKKYSIYNTIGVIAAIKTKFEYSYTASQAFEQGTVLSNNDLKYKYGMNAGLKEAVGLQFNVARNIDLFAEVSGYFLSVTPSSATLTGNNNLNSGGQTANDNIIYNITYKRSGDFDYLTSSQIIGNTRTTTYSYNDQPPSQHMFSVGINAGVRLTLNK